jgi:glycosyltransferase involved in cell wall biosynthesis
VHQYIHHLLRHLAQADGSLHYTVFVGKETRSPDPDIIPVRSGWPTGRAPVRIVWEQCAQPWMLHRIGADLAHGPVFVGPLLSPCPFVITIHDLSFIRFPALFRPANRLYLNALTRISARSARRLIAVSKHTAAEITRLLGTSPERVDVVYHGVDPAFRPLPPDEVEAFRRRRGLPERFVLFLGTLEPRKNLVRLVEAFARIQVEHAGLRLVLAGGRGWLYDELFARVEELGLAQEVVFPGYVANDDLPLWYNAATVLAYPALYEGFGLPVLEALASGTPVLSSNASSLPEAGGNAAVMVDPYDVDALAKQMDRLLNDRDRRLQLRERGLAHASQFTWAQAAQETAQVYQRALAARSAI